VKILYVAVDTPIPGTHGGSVHVQELCRALAHRGHDVHLIAPRPVGSAAVASSDDSISNDITVHRVKRPLKFFEWTAVRKVRALALALSPDVLIERFYTFGGAGIWAAHSLDFPAVLEVNSPARPFVGWRDRLDQATFVQPINRWRRRLLSWSDGIYSTSRHLLPPEIQDSVTIITNGVDVERIRPGPPRAVGDALRCIYVSSFRSWHGSADLIEALALCRKKNVNLKVVCIGAGPQLKAATRAVREAGLNDTVRFLGEVPMAEISHHLADADVGLAPFSPNEFKALALGWFWSPIKIFEYLAAGLIVVTADIPKLKELLPDKVARFYTPGVHTELAQTLERLTTDSTSTLNSVRKTARELARSRYTWEHQAVVVEQLLNSVLARAKHKGSFNAR
jgi:glycosyltransferase involved in cell wall biosynthesis